MKKRIVFVLFGVIGIIGVSLLLFLTFWLGSHSVKQIISGTFEVSQPADIRHATEMTNKYFSMQYPGNWRIDTTDPDYDPDKYFDINAPAQGKVFVYIFAPHAIPQQAVDTIVESTRKVVANRKESRFESWGPHKGYGIQLQGLVVAMNTRVRVFGLGNSQATVVIVEMRYDKDEVNNKNGYDLIAQTFKFKDL